MTVMENLMATVAARVGQWGSLSRRFPPPSVGERAEEAMELEGLTQVPNVEAATLSHSDQKLLDIAIALALEPKVLLLDEPTDGMAPLAPSSAADNSIRPFIEQAAVPFVGAVLRDTSSTALAPISKRPAASCHSSIRPSISFAVAARITIRAEAANAMRR
jgi:ABC-type lipopolysaccharide export system ATPase subunit